MRRLILLFLALLSSSVLLTGQGSALTTKGTSAKAADARTATKAHPRRKARCRVRTTRTASGRKRRVRVCRRPARKVTRPVTVAPKPATPTTPATTTGTVTTTAAAAPDGLRAEVRDCANTERAKAGLPALTDDPALDRAAQAHAEDMRNRDYFAHDTPEGLAPWDRIAAALQDEQPFTSMGENIAMGYADVASTCDGWMNSPGHRANILNPDYDAIGTAWVDSYAVQDFGGRGA